MNRDEFITAHPILDELESRGVVLALRGDKVMAKCPFHADGTPSFSVKVDEGLWFCHAGCGGGSVIDLIAKFDNLSIGEVLGREKSETPQLQQPRPATKPHANGDVKATIDKIYSYQNAFGAEVYQAIRMVPKSFRQRRSDGKGGWTWSMDGVERVLYRLPDVMKNQTVALCEGEKDVETLVSLGYCATCNVGGAGKWLDGYTEALTGKDILIFGDNDKAGEAHVNLVFESIAGKVKTARIIAIPKSVKDVSDFVATFPNKELSKAAIDGLVADAHPFIHGVKLPVFTMAELEGRYQKFIKNADENSFDLGRWLPTLGHKVRKLVPGEVVLIIADTGVGKTAILSNIAIACKPLPTLMFEMELPGELLFERFLAAHMKMPCREVESTYAGGDAIGEKALSAHFRHLYLCWESRQTVENMESIITRSELKIGQRPKVVLIDYIQLIKGAGKSRYERMSSVAEEIKVVAKATQTIIIVASQITRPEGDSPEVGLHDGKDSGSLESSSGLVLGAWREPKDRTCLQLKILKNTKGYAGDIVSCNFDGETMRITERSSVGQEENN